MNGRVSTFHGNEYKTSLFSPSFLHPLVSTVCLVEVGHSERSEEKLQSLPVPGISLTILNAIKLAGNKLAHFIVSSTNSQATFRASFYWQEMFAFISFFFIYVITATFIAVPVTCCNGAVILSK